MIVYFYIFFDLKTLLWGLPECWFFFFMVPGNIKIHWSGRAMSVFTNLKLNRPVENRQIKIQII